ncbi:TetR/AcrR family transcriptional regulator [Sphingomonadaceae bacterium jetA1]|jgi:AcrR family transcriptional regulator|uniref:TetR/AcrR family transcriptional regulator n=1 Tax=Facivitalis istanbulensis TaxID=3075838 RepID=UPI00348EA32E
MKGNTTKQRLLQIGLDQMSVHGVGGVTLGQLATASGISKSGLFAHFKSKEQLQIEVLESMSEMAFNVIFQPALQAPEGLRRLRSVMEHWLGWWRRAGLTGGCPIAGALFEFDDVEGEVRARATAMERQWRQQLATYVLEAKWLGQLAEDTDVDQFVWELCAIYLGHHVSSRFLKSADADMRARHALDALIERHSPPSHQPEAVQP